MLRTGEIARPLAPGVERVVDLRQFGLEPVGRDLARQLVDEMAGLMGEHAILHRVGKRAVDRYIPFRRPRVGVDGADQLARVSANLSRRNCLRTLARRCRCDGVNGRWREGFIRLTHHSASGDVLGTERSPVDVGCESSCPICRRSARIVRRKRALRLDRWIIRRNDAAFQRCREVRGAGGVAENAASREPQGQRHRVAQSGCMVRRVGWLPAEPVQIAAPRIAQILGLLVGREARHRVGEGERIDGAPDIEAREQDHVP